MFQNSSCNHSNGTIGRYMFSLIYWQEHLKVSKQYLQSLLNYASFCWVTHKNRVKISPFLASDLVDTYPFWCGIASKLRKIDEYNKVFWIGNELFFLFKCTFCSFSLMLNFWRIFYHGHSILFGRFLGGTYFERLSRNLCARHLQSKNRNG